MKLSALLYVFSALFASNAFAVNAGITYEGQILKPDLSPISDSATQFRIQIRTPDSGNCLMFEETQTLNMTGSNGNFSLTINDGTVGRTDGTGLTLDRIFANRASFSLDSTKCTSGTGVYAPSVNDARRLQVQFKDSTMGSWETIPTEMLNFVPLAIESKQVQGFGADSLLRVVNGSLDPQTGISPLSNAEYGLLQQLIAGTSTLYTRAGQLNGANMPSMTTSQVLGWNGSTWSSVDPLAALPTFAKAALPTCAVNNFLRNNGSGVFECIAPVGGGTGTVTQVNTGTGLTGGGFTTTGSISIAAQGVDTSQLKDGGVTKIKLATDSVDSARIVDGTITGNDLDPNISILTGAGVTATTMNLKFGAYSVNLVAPSGLANSYALTFPLTGGTNGYVLSTNGSGVTSWVAPGGGGISALTGDVTASGTGSVAATVASVGTSTAANIHAAELLANGATAANTASTIVKRDASGNFNAGTVTSYSNVTGSVIIKIQVLTRLLFKRQRRFLRRMF